MIIGYARLHFKEQTMETQINALREYGVDELYEEKDTGLKRQQEQLNGILEGLKTGDVLVINELNRLGRSIIQTILLAEKLQNKGIRLVSLQEGIDSDTEKGAAIIASWMALSRMHKKHVSEKTAQGIINMKKRGRRGKGIKQETIDRILEMFYSSEYTINEIAAETGISRATVYQYVKKNQGETPNGDE